MTHKLKISDARIISPSGEIIRADMPFSSSGKGSAGTYTYTIQLTNSFLFSGKLQVIPDDCAERLMVNGKPLPASSFREDDCDTRNGFYIDIRPYLVKGSNSFQLDVKNIQGRYGVNIRDVTVYEKYILYALFVFFLLVVDYRYVLLFILHRVRQFLRDNTLQIWIMAGQINLFVLVYAAMLRVPYPNLLKDALLVIFISFSVTPIAFALIRSVRHGRIALIMLGCGIVLWLAYAFGLPYSLYSYDYNGHLEYIRYVASKGEVPVDSGGWSFYHPSLYYRCAALLWKAASIRYFFDDSELIKTVQGFSLIMFIVYSFFSVKTVDLLYRKLCETGKFNASLLAGICQITIALVIFWPANAMFSVRIGNDVMFYLLYSVAFYFTLKWWYTGSNTCFFLALAFAALDTWAKTNAFILLGIIGVLLLFRCFTTRRPGVYRQAFVLKLIVFFMVTGAGFYLSFHERIEASRHDPNTRVVVGNANGLGSNLLVGNKPRNFLLFNPVKFVGIPFTNSFDDAKERNSFWFYLFKSSMFGEFGFDKSVLPLLGSILSGAFLVLLLLAIIGLRTIVGNVMTYLPIIVSLGILMVSMIFFRISYPYSSSGDFRYIFPALTPLILLAGAGLLYVSKNRSLYITALLVSATFLVASVLFQIVTIATL